MPAYKSMRPLRVLILVAIGAVLVATVSSFVNRWKGSGGDSVTATPEPLRGEVDQQTRAFSLSKTEGDRTLYTIKADQVTTLKETQKNLLHGVVVEIFGRNGETRHDRITTAECEYDPIGQTLWVPGEVMMNFGLPESAGSGGTGHSNSGQAQHVVIHTSQLKFDQATGNATTDAEVRFTFPQGAGKSRGANYDSQQQTLQLVSAVEFTLHSEMAGETSGEMAGEAKDGAVATHIRAGNLQYFRSEGRIALDGSVDITKQTRHLRSRAGTVWLDKANQVQKAELTGDVQGSEQSDSLSAEVRAGRANLDFSEAGSIRTINLLEGVTWKAASAPSSPPSREGKSQRMVLAFAPPAGARGKGSELDRGAATGDVQITLRSNRSRVSSAANSGSGIAGQSQVLTGQQAEMQFADGGKLMRDAKLSGAPKIEMRDDAAAAPRTIVADKFDFDFGPGGELTQFNAADNVRVTSPVPATPTAKADTRITTSRDLLARFDPVTGKLESFKQSGSFTYQDATRKAQAGTALYQAETELLTLERSPSGQSAGKGQAQPAITQADGRIAADTIKLFTRSNDLDASGSVATTSTARNAPGASANAGAEPIHAVADKLSYDDASQTARYVGHARLWQGTGFLLESESAVLDRQKNILTATGKVLTIFRPAVADTGKKGAGAPAGIYTVRSDQVNYAQTAGRIFYEGNVRANQDSGTLTSKTLEITLKKAASNAAADLQSTASRIDKMTARGEVQMQENGRVGSGDTVEYFADNKKVNLYGKPAVLTDPARGSTKGVQLTYQIGDNRASVVGDGGEQTETRWIPNK